MRVFCLCFFITVCVFGTIAHAQDLDFYPSNPAFEYAPGEKFSEHDMYYFYNPRFDHTVRIAYVTWPVSKFYSFYQLRSYYKQTRQYDPLGDTLLDRLSGYAFAASQADTSLEKARQTGLFQDLVLRHLAHVDVLLMALSFARDDPDFGDPAFYEWIRDGILYDIMSKSDGKTMKDPFILLTMGEELSVFQALGVRSVHAELVSDGHKFFHIHLVEDLKTGKQSELFTDVSIPMRILKRDYNRKRQDASRSLNLKRQ